MAKLDKRLVGAMRVDIDGLSDLDRALGELPRATAKNVARRTLRKAAKPIRDDAERLAPDDPATDGIDLHRSIAVSARAKVGRSLKRLFEGPTTTNVYIGPIAALPRYVRAIAQEFGTTFHPPQPYMRPAWDANKAKALEIIKDGLGVEIMKAAKRMARKAAKTAAKR